MLKRKELPQFFLYMSQFYSSGVNVADSLDYCKRLFPSKAEEFELARDMVRKDGSPLYLVLKKLELVPDNVLPGIRAGEGSGELSSVLKSMNEFYAQFQAILDNSLPKLLTPVLYIFAGLLIFVGFVLFLFPTFIPPQATLDDPNILVRITLYGEVVKNNWLISSVITIGAVVACVMAGMNKNIRASALEKMFSVPLLGAGLYELYVAMWARFFAILVNAGVPYSDCLRLTDGVVPDVVANDFELLRRIDRESNAELIKDDALVPERWPPLLIAALRTGIPIGRTGQLLEQNSKDIMENGERKIGQFVVIANLVGLLFVGIEVALIMVSILLMNLSKTQGL